MERCNVCEKWGIPPEPHLHIEEDVEGLLEITDLEKNENTLEAENAELSEAIVYRYVWSPSDLFKIASSQLIASVAKCFCINCINYSLSFIPHYGDGAYCTANEQLKLESPRVIHAHGIDIRGMNYRVVMRVKNISGFKKIKKTAGVIRSVPIGKKLYVGQLVFCDEKAIKIIGFQKWDGKEWIDVSLDELKGGELNDH
ncbi:hypothetical protein [Thermaerobacillus caldiproteolyticus]|uniref:Uncharacterized protein n=1 Tax=Thermaerobacillus caldiproteolyticus TaxID=247480 RepID=A0A7W0C099_9BACL|nr:hypothetical protein [Anoxybacillus caldiproteolyticus]MBA2876908.1 hypothetical protein [Anoxybacillus caldiproteolyticus]